MLILMLMLIPFAPLMSRVVLYSILYALYYALLNNTSLSFPPFFSFFDIDFDKGHEENRDGFGEREGFLAPFQEIGEFLAGRLSVEVLSSGDVGRL
jgi:hypothetical protein